MSTEDTKTVTGEIERLLAEEQYPQAIKSLNAALQRDPENAEFHFLRARANAGWSANDDAERDFARAIAIEPDQMRYHLALGHLLLDQEQFDNAATAFARAQHLAPDDVDVQLSFLEIQTIRGAFDDVIPELEKLQRQHSDNEQIASMLAVAYYEKGIENWHREESEQGVMICAMNADDISVGSTYLRKIDALLPRTETVNNQSADLAEIISLGKKRRFQGGWFSWVVPLIILIIGASIGGFVGSVYAVSAVAFCFAFWRPTYVSNYLHYTNRDDFSAADRIMSFIDGNWMVFAPSISGVITQQLKIAAYMQVMRAAIIGIFLPFSVFSAFRQNYGMKHAASFAAVALAVGFAASYGSGPQLPGATGVVNTERPAQTAPPPGDATTSVEATALTGRIPIRNAGFEQDSLGAEGWKFGVTAWSGSRHGTMLPSATVFNGGIAPEGNQLAFLSQAGSSMSQGLPIQVRPGWRYTLQVFAGLRADNGFESGNYDLQILSGSGVLASRTYATPDKGEFVASELVFDAPGSVQSSGPMTIRVVNTDARQINFDDVRFYAWPADAGETAPALTFSTVRPVPVKDGATTEPVNPVPIEVEEGVAEEPAQVTTTVPATAVQIPPTSVGNAPPVQPQTMPQYWHMRITPVSDDVQVDAGIRAFWDKGVYVFFREDGDIGFNTDVPGPYFYQGSKKWRQSSGQLSINLDGMPYELTLPDTYRETLSTVDSGPGTFRMLLDPKASGQR